VRAKITPAAIVSLVISFIAMAFWLLAVAGGIGTIIERGGRGEDLLTMIFFLALVSMNLIAFIGSIRMLQM
jgi:hypothetical protein